MSFTRTEDQKVRAELTAALNERILVVDGATGTGLEEMQPTASDFGGEEFVGCNEMLNLHAPHIVRALHKAYIEAGVDIIETNSFNGSPIVMEEYGIPEKARELARLSAENAHAAIDEYANGRRVYVMGSMGPGTKAITVTGGATFADIYECYRIYALGLLEGGADILLLETVQDTLNLKASILGIRSAMKELDREPPLSVSVTIEMGGTMLAGQNIEALYHTMSGFDLFSLGLNCATGPAMMTDHLRELARMSRFPVSVWPNAGLPDTDGNYSEGPDLFKEVIGRFAREGFINLAGGCCGTTPAHISAIRETVDGLKPRQPNTNGNYPALAGAEPMLVEEDNRPVFIGERTNTIGSRAFKRLIGEGNWDEAAEVGRGQVRKGAMVIDVCAADPDRNEVDDFLGVLKPLLRKVRVPIMVDTTDPEVVREALRTIGGKPAINSVNLEDGGERMREIAVLAKEYGASLVCGLIDDDPEQGMAVTIERKLEVAENIHNILVGEYGIPESDIIFDPLVFPAATGDKNYIGAAEATIEGTRKVKEKYPNCLTILGISNVSFGLPTAGREVVNSVFLYLCAKAGLDMAIVNTTRLKRYPTISDAEKELAKKLLMLGDNETIAEFTAFYRNTTTKATEDEWDALSTDEKVSRAIVEARKTGLEKNLKELLDRGMKPLEVINGPLLSGMDEVGRLFADNSLIVAEVLESAEVMKAAVDFIKPFFPPGDEQEVKARMILATVKGDVHDIGKNLVDMIMSNNGFEIINLGIKVPPEALIEAVAEHKPDLIGLSGLLVRSAQQMVSTASDLAAAGINLPILVGGAALSKKFTLSRITPAYNAPVFYAAEAMEGLALGNEYADEKRRGDLIEKWRKLSEDSLEDVTEKVVKPKIETVRPAEWIETSVPEPPDLDEHIIDNINVGDVLPYLNENMLLGKHLGMKGVTRRLADPNDEKVAKLRAQIEEVGEEAIELGIIEPKAIFRWFKARPDGEDLLIDNPHDGSTVKFNYPRQQGRRGISAVDWIRPPEKGGDHVGIFVVTAGKDTVEPAARMRKEGRLLASHILQALSLEMAEATAEWVHRVMRAEWGFPDDESLTVRDLYLTKYQGIRLSFGYPACPELEYQEGLFKLLKPESIGVQLTEGYMMSPEASVSAVVFHHPEGKYYAI